jgi:cytochrome c553
MSKKIFGMSFVLAGLLASGVAFAGTDAANGKKIFMEGKGAAAPCMSCHGENGQGNDGMGAPRLANIGYAYIVKQLTDLAGDKRMPSGAGAVMPMFAKELNDQDRKDVAAYLSSIKAKPELSNLAELKAGGQVVGEVRLGQEIVNFGKGKVPACQSCHSYNGRGAEPMFPKIGQQKYVYLFNQLNNWRDASRANDPAAMMRTVAKNLTDADIANVAAYLATAPETTSGNSRVPDNEVVLKAVNKK